MARKEWCTFQNWKDLSFIVEKSTGHTAFCRTLTLLVGLDNNVSCNGERMADCNKEHKDVALMINFYLGKHEFISEFFLWECSVLFDWKTHVIYNHYIYINNISYVTNITYNIYITYSITYNIIVTCYTNITYLIIYMKKLLDSDWLRAVQFKHDTSANYTL